MLTFYQLPAVEKADAADQQESDKTLRILFYHAGSKSEHDTVIWLNPTALQLKTQIDLGSPQVADKLEWLIPLQQQVSDEELIEYIAQNNVDILCTSHYLWNHEFLKTQLCNVRKKLKNSIKIVAGGPSIDVNNNKDFFDQYPYIDYAVYAAGEQAFADIVSHLVLKKPMIAFNTSNCAWKNHHTGKPIVADYKFVKMIEVSPFLHNAEMLAHMVADAKKKNLRIWLPYTVTRGCPYSCTFCDWNSGLGNKVSRRKNTYQQDINLFQQLKISHIYLADANVGQYTEDVEMIEYFAQKNLQENAGFRLLGNFSKLQKDNNYKIFDIIAYSNLASDLHFSIQDINVEILKNIDRPDVGWDVHLAMANKLREKYPHFTIKAQLIYGLPGQTAASWRNTLEEVTKHNFMPMCFLNEPLPASPAVYDPEYQRKFQFQYVYSTRLDGDVKYQSNIPKNSSSFDQKDIVQMTILSAFYWTIVAINSILYENNQPALNISTVIDRLLKSENYSRLYHNLYHNWVVDNNFYYTINFSGQPDQIGDTGLRIMLLDDKFFYQYLIKYEFNNEHDTVNRRKFSQMYLQSIFKKSAPRLLDYDNPN